MKLLEASQAARRTHRVFPATRIHFGDCHERNVMKHPLLDLQFELALSVTVVEKKEKRRKGKRIYYKVQLKWCFRLTGHVSGRTKT